MYRINNNNKISTSDSSHDNSNNVNSCSSHQTFSFAIPTTIRKHLTIIPISNKNEDSTKMVRNKKCMKPVSYEQDHPFNPSNFKVLKDISLNPIVEKENSLVSMLKKLPDITFNCVETESVFKIPESPKQITTNPKRNIQFENKPKILSERRNVLDTIDLTKMHVNHKKILKQNQVTKNNTVSIKNDAIFQKNKAQIKNNNDKIIPKKLQATPIKDLHSKKENIQRKRTSTPHKVPMKLPIISKITSEKLKTVRPVKETSKTFMMSLEEKQIIDNNAIINKTEIQTKESDNEDFTLMDISSEGKINIVPASPNVDFSNVNIPDYNSFALAIDKDFKYNMEKTSQSYMGNASFIRQELTDSSPRIRSIPYGIEKLDNGQNSNSYFKDALLQNNDTYHNMNACFVDKEEQFLHEMRNLFCDNIIDKTSENKLQKDITLIPDKKDLSNDTSNEIINRTKRQQFQNQGTTNKKLKTDN